MSIIDWADEPLPKTKLRLKLRGGSANRWMEVDPVLGLSEPGHEIDTGKLKIGDGASKWSELPYVTVDSDVIDHINDPTPHPSYDDAPSFTLLFENGLI